MGGVASRCKCSPCLQGLQGGQVSKKSGRPIRVVVAGAAGQIGYALLPMIANGDMFGQDQRVIIHSLDLNHSQVKDNMKGIKDELDDGNFPLLVSAEYFTDDRLAFKDADYALLLGAYPRADGKGDKEILEKNILIFRTMGQAIKNHASKDCKVLVSGPPANTNAVICAEYMGNGRNVFALSRLDQNRASAQIQLKGAAGHHGKDKEISCRDVKNVVVWGHCVTNTDGDRCIDADFCQLFNQPIKMTRFFRDKDQERWLQNTGKNTLNEAVKHRGQSIVGLRKASSALSAAKAITDQIHDLHCGTAEGEYSSMGVMTTGDEYGIEKGLIFSLPVICRGNGTFEVMTNLLLSDSVKRAVREASDLLRREKRAAQDMWSKHGGEKGRS